MNLGYIFLFGKSNKNIYMKFQGKFIGQSQGLIQNVRFLAVLIFSPPFNFN